MHLAGCLSLALLPEQKAHEKLGPERQLKYDIRAFDDASFGQRLAEVRLRCLQRQLLCVPSMARAGQC